MKTNKTIRCFMAVIALVLSIVLFCGFSASAADYDNDWDDEYDGSEYNVKIIDNVVYELFDWGKYAKNPQYVVMTFGATKEIRRQMTQINIVGEIDGIPVTRILGEDGYSFHPVSVYPNVKEITIPDSVKRIESYCFTRLINLEKITLSKNLTYLGEQAFYNLKNLKEVVIPKGIEIIRTGTFKKCTGLQKVTFLGDVAYISDFAFANCTSLKSVSPLKKLKSIDRKAFYNCRSLKNFEFPATIKSIGSASFENSGLTSVKIPAGPVLDHSTSDLDSTPYYGAQFRGCKNLKSVVFEDTKKKIEIPFDCFNNCPALKTVVFPKSSKEIVLSPGAFGGSGLTSIKLPSSIVFEKEVTGDDVSPECYDGAQFKNCKKLKKVVFESTKKEIEIPNDCFAGCTALKTVVLPKSAKELTLCTRAFSGCTALKTVENSGMITEIYPGAFKNCKSLETIKFSSRIKRICRKAFSGCSNLKSITFKDTKNVPGYKYNSKTNKSNGKFDKETFSGTPSNMKFFVKNATVAKKLKTALKGSGVKSARIYSISGKTLYYKNVK